MRRKCLFLLVVAAVAPSTGAPKPRPPPARGTDTVEMQHSLLVSGGCRSFPPVKDNVPWNILAKTKAPLEFPAEIKSYASRVDDSHHVVEIFDTNKNLLAIGSSTGGAGTAVMTTFGGAFLNYADGGWSDCTASVLPASNTTAKVVCKVNSAQSLPRFRWFRGRTTSNLACVGTYARCDSCGAGWNRRTGAQHQGVYRI